MANGETIISGGGDRYVVKAVGRATFECVAPLRNLAKELDKVQFKQIDIDLADCQGMDSTYMGVLAMMALRSKKINASISIYNASELNKTSLCGLGLKRLFLFKDGPVEMAAQIVADAAPADRKTSAETVLDAHKTLMDVDQENVGKFEKVVDFVQKDLDRLNETSE